VPKPDPPWRSEEYRAYVASHRCCLCQKKRGPQGGVVAAHIGSRGTSQKPPDYQTVPLCYDCHAREHGRPGYEPLSRDEREHLVWVALKLAGKFIAAIRSETLDIEPGEALSYREQIEAGREQVRARRKKKTKIGQRKPDSRRPRNKGIR